MKHYSHYLMQNKVHKEIDHLIQDMFQHTVSLQGNGESFVDKYQQFSDYYGQIQRVLIEAIENYAP
jgi:hypothetical protein